MQLILDLVMVLIGFWAISPDSATVSSYRGAVLLVVWIGAAALIRGMADIIVGSASTRRRSGSRAFRRPDRRSRQAAVKAPSTG